MASPTTDFAQNISYPSRRRYRRPSSRRAAAAPDQDSTRRTLVLIGLLVSALVATVGVIAYLTAGQG